MRTLNEQIERLRDILHTCYESIARKGGTLPPIGERNMTNLPDAVESVPQVVGAELEELTITENGEYTPQDGVDGFSKVTAEFDTSSLPKVKVSNFKVTSACINEDGIWEGERLIDTSACTTLAEMCFSNSKIVNIDASGWNTSNVKSLSNTFYDCKNLGTINVTGWDVSNVTNFHQTFIAHNNTQPRIIIGYEDWDVRNAISMSGTIFYTKGMDILDYRKWEIPNVTAFSNMIPAYFLVKSLVGGESLESVIANNTTIFKGLKVGYKMSNAIFIEDRASLRALINGLADLTGQATQTIGLNRITITGQTTSAFDTLTEEDIAIATAKNWTITSVG